MGFKYDATGVNPDMKFAPAPAGKYWLIIREANPKDKEGNDRISKNGNPIVNCLCEIDEGVYIGTRVYHNVTFIPKEKKGAGMTVHFLKTIGEPWEGEIEAEPENWVGKRFRAQLKVEKDMRGNDRNQIAYVLGEEEPSDEVPF